MTGQGDLAKGGPSGGDEVGGNVESGYPMIADRLMADQTAYADSWNFGPSESDARSVSWIVDRMQALWDGDALPPAPWTGTVPHEARYFLLQGKSESTQGHSS